MLQMLLRSCFVAFTNRALKQTKGRFAQIEKEFLEIVFSMEKIQTIKTHMAAKSRSQVIQRH